MKNNVKPIFVYGTLRNGFGNYEAFLKGYTEKEVLAFTKGKLYSNLHNTFPCMLPGNDRVVGEVMFVKPQFYRRVLANLDRLEGYYKDDEEFSMYLRREINVSLEDGTEIKAWGYIWNGGKVFLGEYIPDGDWANFKLKQLEKWG